ncbi:probable cytochrome P450 CYP44 [Aplysia californica]|uniref:Probable cytochrome P450 CYP44 n=1 Tax=Aplysia californica TaxID=6500 RepID=A0ABM0JMW6_APLCA|nr:probable cytochrome P450 CYP44 [Aplysia californica]XP_005097414.1 probable cytochrome P450 CYP44 [Aplysia californica]
MAKPLLMIGRTWNRLEVQASIYCCQRSTVAERYGASSTCEEYENAQPFSKIPGPKGLPFIGSWLDYKLNPNKIHRRDTLIREMQSEYGDIVKENIAGRDIVHLFGLDFIRQIYNAEGKHPVIPPLLFPVKHYRHDKNLSPGLGNSNGEQWYKLRSVVQQVMLRPQKAFDYLPMQNEVANDFISKIESILDENREVPHFNRWVARWGLESAANITFDRRMGFLEETGHAVADKIIQSNSDVFDLSSKFFFSLPFYKFFPTHGMKRIYECEDFILGEGERLLKEAIKDYEIVLNSGELTDDRFRFLSYMLSNDSVSYKDMAAVVNSVFTDTLSTTSFALLFNLYMLANNPEAQDRAYEEANTILSSSGDVTVEGFNSSRYIKACIKETFRFLPIGIDIQRLCPANMVIGGYQVPEGTYLVLEPHVSQHDPKYVAEPEKYLPERWLREETGTEKTHPYLLIPFSIGTRMCAGRRFAEQELVMMLAKLLSHYRLEWHHGPVNMRYRLLQVPDRDVTVRFVPR